MADTKEKVELNRAEMDVIFTALERLEKEGAAVLDRAMKMKAARTAVEQIKFNKNVEELKQKFLHD